MPKKHRVMIYAYLFREGVMTCEKDVRLPTHHILPIPNVHVRDALKSLKSRGFIRELFNWQWHYYFLEDSGVEYLRKYLQLDENVVPHTLKKPAKPIEVRGDRPRGFGRGGAFGDKAGAPGEFRPRFGGEGGGYRREGGFGRGRVAAEGAGEAAAPAPAATE